MSSDSSNTKFDSNCIMFQSRSETKCRKEIQNVSTKGADKVFDKICSAMLCTRSIVNSTAAKVVETIKTIDESSTAQDTRIDGCPYWIDDDLAKVKGPKRGGNVRCVDKFPAAKKKRVQDPQVPLLKAQVKGLQEDFMSFIVAVKELIPGLNLSTILSRANTNMEGDDACNVPDNSLAHNLKNPRSTSVSHHPKNSTSTTTSAHPKISRSNATSPHGTSSHPKNPTSGTHPKNSASGLWSMDLMSFMGQKNKDEDEDENDDAKSSENVESSRENEVVEPDNEANATRELEESNVETSKHDIHNLALVEADDKSVETSKIISEQADEVTDAHLETNIALPEEAESMLGIKELLQNNVAEELSTASCNS
ncbi:hypothetical protein Tco_0420440 [Tanacetum coccineum]